MFENINLSLIYFCALATIVVIIFLILYGVGLIDEKTTGYSAGTVAVFGGTAFVIGFIILPWYNKNFTSHSNIEFFED